MADRLTRLSALLRAMGRILFLRWPDYDFNDLATVQDSLDGPAFQRAAERMRVDPTGREMLDHIDAPTLRNTDWTYLSTLPVDSFGYNIWHHFHANGILHPVDLDVPEVRWDPDTEQAKAWYRGTHDVRHVMVGLGITGADEVVLQAFQCAQLPQKLSVMIVLLGGLKHALIDGEARRLLRDVPRAWRLGRRARFLSLLDVNRFWETPLMEVRAQFGIEPLGTAYPVAERHPEAPWETPREWMVA